MLLRISRGGRFVTVSPKCTRRLTKVLQFISNRTLDTFLRNAKGGGEIPRASADRALEILNQVYWNDTSLRQSQKDLLRSLYVDMKAELQGGRRVPRSPKSPSKPKLTLEEIKKRQQQRKRSMSNIKQQLIRLGAKQPHLQPHLKEILDKIAYDPGNPDDIAAGVLGPRWNRLRDRGYKAIKAPTGMGVMESDALGPLPGAKVKQLLERGITLVKESSVQASPRTASAWRKWEEVVRALGDEEALSNLMQYVGGHETRENFEHIARMHDLPVEVSSRDRGGDLMDKFESYLNMRTMASEFAKATSKRLLEEAAEDIKNMYGI